MPEGSGYSGKTQGDSGKAPSKGRGGAYGYVSQRYGDATTPNMQGWNGYSGEPTRGADIKGGGMKKAGGDSDY